MKKITKKIVRKENDWQFKQEEVVKCERIFDLFFCWGERGRSVKRALVGAKVHHKNKQKKKKRKGRKHCQERGTLFNVRHSLTLLLF